MPGPPPHPAAHTLPWRSWYGLERWKKRARHQLKVEPLCRACLERGFVVPATIADHVEPHRGNWNAFRLGPLQSLCQQCHAGKWAADQRGSPAEIGYRGDIGEDGWPTDPRHPANRTGSAR